MIFIDMPLPYFLIKLPSLIFVPISMHIASYYLCFDFMELSFDLILTWLDVCVGFGGEGCLCAV